VDQYAVPNLSSSLAPPNRADTCVFLLIPTRKRGCTLDLRFAIGWIWLAFAILALTARS
jgi:hypothetical protein